MFKLSRFVLGLALAGAVILPALATQPATPEQVAPFQLAAAQRVTDKANGFSIVPPAGWEAGEPNEQTFLIYLDAPKDNFRANFNVNVSEDDSTPIKEIGKYIKPEFAKQFDKWKLVSEGTVTLGGQPAYFISSRFSMQGYDIQNLQYYIRGKKKRFYVLTFTALASSYKSYESAFKQTAASVQAMN